MKGQSTIVNFFMLRRILEKFYGFKLDFHLLFIGFKQACYTIKRMYSYEIIYNFGFQRNL